MSNDPYEELKPYWSNHAVWGDVECDLGWRELILNTHRKIAALCPSYKIIQIKQKFGELRYYYVADKTDEKAWAEAANVAVQAEIDSVSICETCGKPGVLRSEGWIKTLCDSCEALHAGGFPANWDIRHRKRWS